MQKVWCAWLVGISVMMMITLPCEAGWYGTYGYRQKITIAAGAVGADLADFPVLITEANVQAALWSHARPDGGDLAFTLSKAVLIGATGWVERSVEIEVPPLASRLELGLSAAGGAGTCWFDCFNLETVRR